MTARLVNCLAILACLQLGIIALLYWPESVSDPGAAATSDTLLPVSRDKVGRIGVTDANGNSVMVVGRDGQWMIEADALPAATSVVDRLLDTLAAPAGFPVARSESARERFEVAAGVFQRRITFADRSDETDAGEAAANDATTVYLGTSPGMRRVHARRGDSAAILTISLNTFDVPATVDGWLDPNLLSMDAIEQVAVAGGEWNKQGNAWTATGEGAIENAAATDALMALERALANLQITGILADEARPQVSAQAAFEFTVTGSSQAVDLQLAPMTEGGEARLYSSQFDRWFTLDAHDRDQLTGALDGLTEAMAPAGKNAGSETTGDDASAAVGARCSGVRCILWRLGRGSGIAHGLSLHHVANNLLPGKLIRIKFQANAAWSLRVATGLAGEDRAVEGHRRL